MKAIPEEAAVLQAGEDLQLRLWDSRTMQPVQMLSQHSNIPLCCDVSADGKVHLTACEAARSTMSLFVGFMYLQDLACETPEVYPLLVTLPRRVSILLLLEMVPHCGDCYAF